MTEKKTCYNCGNKNCHIFYATVKQDIAVHHETYEYTDFDCVNHDKWEEMKVEEIRTDSTETLKNALERIAELEKEKAELKEQCSIFDKSLVTSTKNNIERQKIIDEIKEQLTEAKKIIGEFVEWANWQGSKCPSFKSIQNKAEQFLKTEVSVWNPKRTENDPDKLTDDVMNDWKEMEE